MTEQIGVCPECDSHALQHRTARPGGADRDENSGKWRCEDCGQSFDEPARREPKRTREPQHGLAARLLEIGRRGA